MDCLDAVDIKNNLHHHPNHKDVIYDIKDLLQHSWEVISDILIVYSANEVADIV